MDDDAGLSAGAKAGIGIGITLLVLGIIGVVAFIVLRKRRRANAGAEASPNGSIRELHGSTRRPTEMPQWTDEKKDGAITDVKDQSRSPTYAVEAPGDSHWPGRMHEMDADSVRTYEMSSETGTNANTNNSTRKS